MFTITKYEEWCKCNILKDGVKCGRMYTYNSKCSSFGITLTIKGVDYRIFYIASDNYLSIQYVYKGVKLRLWSNAESYHLISESMHKTLIKLYSHLNDEIEPFKIIKQILKEYLKCIQ